MKSKMIFSLISLMFAGNSLATETDYFDKYLNRVALGTYHMTITEHIYKGAGAVNDSKHQKEDSEFSGIGIKLRGSISDIVLFYESVDLDHTLYDAMAIDMQKIGAGYLFKSGTSGYLPYVASVSNDTADQECGFVCEYVQYDLSATEVGLTHLYTVDEHIHTEITLNHQMYSSVKDDVTQVMGSVIVGAVNGVMAVEVFGAMSSEDELSYGAYLSYHF